MNSRSSNSSERNPQQGYALLMVMLLTAFVVIGMSAAVLDALNQGHREQEKELIWRGKQYDLGIKRYYKKNGKYPTSLDDLFADQVGNLHFMRKRYKDPFNPVDDSWRFIYVGANGALINSLMFTSLQDMSQKLQPPNSKKNPLMGSGPLGGAQPGQPTFGGLGGGGFGGGGSFGGGGFGNSGFGNNPLQQQQQNQNGQNGLNSQSGFGGSNTTNGNGTDSGQQGLNLPVSDSSDNPDGTVVGGSLVGVASKINKKSIKVFQLGKTYKTWEFIYNQQMDQAQQLNSAMGGGNLAGGGIGGKPGQGLSSSPVQSPTQNPNGGFGGGGFGGGGNGGGGFGNGGNGGFGNGGNNGNGGDNGGSGNNPNGGDQGQNPNGGSGDQGNNPNGNGDQNSNPPNR